MTSAQTLMAAAMAVNLDTRHPRSAAPLRLLPQRLHRHPTPSASAILDNHTTTSIKNNTSSNTREITWKQRQKERKVLPTEAT